jgi:hypothetical protein
VRYTKNQAKIAAIPLRIGYAKPREYAPSTGALRGISDRIATEEEEAPCLTQCSGRVYASQRRLPEPFMVHNQ